MIYRGCGTCEHSVPLSDDTLDGFCVLNPPQYVPIQARLAKETWGREWVYPKVVGEQIPCSHYEASEKKFAIAERLDAAKGEQAK